MRLLTIVALLALTALVAAQEANVPIENPTLVPLGGIDADVSMVANADAGRPALKVALTKADESRRLLAFEAAVNGDVSGAKAVELRYRLALENGEARPAAVFFDDAGGAWYKTGNPLAEEDEFVTIRLAITNLRPAAFSSVEGDLDWAKLDKIWVGIVVDGAASGTLEVSDAHFTSERYVATTPLRITGDGAGKWSVGKDPAVTATLTTPDEGRDGEPCMKLEFNFVGGRHMYVTPSTPVPAAELEGYSALQFTYKATLPAGLEGLLVLLTESGGQFMASPMPPATDDWVQITIPFEDFKLGGWSKDDNGQLDLDRVDGVIIGTHGGADDKGGDGLIMVYDLQFVP